jgi:hypothetical protein
VSEPLTAEEAVYQALLMLTQKRPRATAPQELIRLLEMDGFTVATLDAARPSGEVDASARIAANPAPARLSGPCVECGWYPTIEPENSRARNLRWARHKAHATPAPGGPTEADLAEAMSEADASMKDELGRRRTRNRYYWRDLAKAIYEVWHAGHDDLRSGLTEMGTDLAQAIDARLDAARPSGDVVTREECNERIARAVEAGREQERDAARPSGDMTAALRAVAVAMVRGTHVCEKPHRNGEANPHVHFDDRYIAEARHLAALAAALDGRREKP